MFEVKTENPYSPRRPVGTIDDFYGREGILDEIGYEISQGGHVALVGDRGKGKSSVKSVVIEEAKNSDIFCADIELENEELGLEDFFAKLLESIPASGDDRFYSRFQEWVTNPDSMDFNFRFLKLHYDTSTEEAALGGSNALKSDFREIAQSVDARQIVLIVDDFQYLKDESHALQVIKSVFSELEGYSLFLVGESGMVSDIKSHHSPLARMLKRIEIDSFKTGEAARRAIVDPLDEDLQNHLPESTVDDIVAITGGDPYEINLVCYEMFKHFDGSQADQLELNAEVLHSVLSEIRDWRGLDNDIARDLSTLDNRKLKILVSAAEAPGLSRKSFTDYATLYFADIADAEYYLEKHQQVTEDIETLLDEGYLIDDAGIDFLSDRHSLVYLKYVAKAEALIDRLFRRSDEEGIIAHIHRRIADDLVLDDVEGHSHFIPDYDAHQAIFHDISEGNHPDAANINDVYLTKTSFGNYYRTAGYEDHDSSDEYKGRTVSCRFEFRDIGGFRSLFHCETDEATEAVKQRIQRLEGSLDEIGIRVVWPDESGLVRRGDAAYRDDNLVEAIEKYSKAIEIYDDIPEPWLHRGRAYLFEGNLKKALSDVNTALDLRDDWTEAYEIKGRILLKQGQPAAAREEFVNAVGLTPESPDIWSRLCHITENHGFHDVSTEVAERAIEENELNDHILYHYISSLETTDKWEEVIEVGEAHDDHIVEESGFYTQIIGEIGKSHAELGNETEAHEIIEKLDCSDRNDADYQKVPIYEALGNSEKALDILESIDYTDIRETYHKNAARRKTRLLLEFEEYEEAREFASGILGRISVSMPWLNFYLAIAEAQVGRNDNAVSQLGEAVDAYTKFATMAKSEEKLEPIKDMSGFKSIVDDA